MTVHNKTHSITVFSKEECVDESNALAIKVSAKCHIYNTQRSPCSEELYKQNANIRRTRRLYVVR